MKELIYTFRQKMSALNEAAFTVQQIPEEVMVAYEINDEYAYVQFVWEAGNKVTEEEADQYNVPYGMVWAVTTREDAAGPCLKAYMVENANVSDGYGPLLYDAIMELVTRNGAGLIADRASVSREALRVWDYYLRNRTDVEYYQLDDLKNSLTPTPEDNCKQIASRKWSRTRGGRNNKWHDEALSKMFVKPQATVLTALESSGQLLSGA